MLHLEKLCVWKLQSILPKFNFRNTLKKFPILTFFYIHTKKIMDSRKFSTSGFRCIYIFWDVLKTSWPFLENICLYVYLQNFVDTVSQHGSLRSKRLSRQLKKCVHGELTNFAAVALSICTSVARFKESAIGKAL